MAEGALLTPANNNDPFEPLRPSALKERRFPCRELPCADDLSLTPANSNTAARYIPNVEFPLGEIFMKKAMTSADPGPHGNPSTAVAVAANVAASAVEAAYEEGLARLKARAFERLELDERLEKLSEEVDKQLNARKNLTQFGVNSRNWSDCSYVVYIVVGGLILGNLFYKQKLNLL